MGWDGMEGDLRWRGPDKSVETVTADWTGGMEEAAKKAGGVPWRRILQEAPAKLGRTNQSRTAGLLDQGHGQGSGHGATGGEKLATSLHPPRERCVVAKSDFIRQGLAIAFQAVVTARICSFPGQTRQRQSIDVAALAACCPCLD